MPNAMSFGSVGANASIDKISDTLRDYAKAQCSLASIPRIIKAKGGKGGQVIQVKRAGRLTQQNTTAPLGENQRTPDATLPLDSVSLQLYEYGVGVTHTDLLEQLAEYDINNVVQQELAQWLAETRDSLIYNQLNSTFVSYAPQGTEAAPTYGPGSFDTNGIIAKVATRNFNANDVVAMKNKMRDTFKTPYFPDGTYHFHAPATTLDYVLRDPRIQAVMNAAYQGRGASSPTVNGELTVWNKIKFIEDNFAISPTLLSATNYIGGGILVGNDAVGEATALSPRLFLDPPEDGGRFHRVVMRGTWGVKLIWGGTAADVAANQVRVIRVASANA